MEIGTGKATKTKKLSASMRKLTVWFNSSELLVPGNKITKGKAIKII